jgi:hypothetical protein
LSGVTTPSTFTFEPETGLPVDREVTTKRTAAGSSKVESVRSVTCTRIHERPVELSRRRRPTM